MTLFLKEKPTNVEEYPHEFAEHHYHTYTPLEKIGSLWAVRAGRNAACHV
jgi:hypothetical protein